MVSLTDGLIIVELRIVKKKKQNISVRCNYLWLPIQPQMDAAISSSSYEAHIGLRLLGLNETLRPACFNSWYSNVMHLYTFISTAGALVVVTV